jgi:hypothetical protein
VSLANAISVIAAGDVSHPYGLFLTALAMSLVVLGQVSQLRKQEKPPSK